MVLDKLVLFIFELVHLIVVGTASGSIMRTFDSFEYIANLEGNHPLDVFGPEVKTIVYINCKRKPMLHFVSQATCACETDA